VVDTTVSLNFPDGVCAEQLSSKDLAPAHIAQDGTVVDELDAMDSVDMQSPPPISANDSTPPSFAASTKPAPTISTEPGDGRYNMSGFAHWFDAESNVPVSALTAKITPDDERYEISSVAHWFVEKADVRIGTVSLSEFIDELASQFTCRKTYSEKHVVTILVKFAYREVTSYDLEPQDGFCNAKKVVASILLQRRTMIGHTSVYKFLKSLAWKEGRTTLREIERVFKVEAEEEKAYLASPKYQKLLLALSFIEE
jgi:hypothetical protein